MNEPMLMNASEVMRLLGISRSDWERKKKEFAKMFEVKRPMGIRRYSRHKVEAYGRGESTVSLGRRTA